VRKVITAAEMREIDRLTTERYALPSLLLMEQAAGATARAIAARCKHDLAGLQVLILCGRGNNGGDGAALARLLWLAGAFVDVVLFGSVGDTRGDARINFEIVRQLAEAQLTVNDLARPAWLSFKELPADASLQTNSIFKASYNVIVDALFGTGLTRPLTGIYAGIIEHLTAEREERFHTSTPSPIFVSLDLPSGLDADSAEQIGPTVTADLTVTFTAPKPANVLPPAAHFNGELVVADIGSPFKLLEDCASQLFIDEAADARRWLEQTRYTPDSYKNTHGHALVIAGSRHMTGAPVLTSDAAMRAGAGLVTVATPTSAHAAVAARVMPEVMTAELAETEAGAISDVALDEVRRLAARANVVALGPGLTADDERTRRFVRALVEGRTTPLVVDADGLNALAPWPAELHGTREQPLILTPHIGEMRRLIGRAAQDALADRVAVAREFANAQQLIVVLKGARTIIAAPDGRVVVNATGNAGLGTAGAGDTLTGIITGCLAQAYGTLKDKADAFATVVAAVYLGGLAGDIAARERGMRTMVASDIREHLGAAVCALDATGEEPR
jgi:ADP-dependent NAD(P)H-hydrate dehydratase / NAD(P)H-hydrate epimerase